MKNMIISKKNEFAIILVSGGMDSAVTAAIAMRKFTPFFLHINYGQRTEKKELWAFKKLKEFYKVKNYRIITIPYLKEFGGSSLVSKEINIPILKNNPKQIPSTYVPFRNTHLLSIAVSLAETLGINYVFYGANFVDSAGYPDCRIEYVKALNKLIRAGTRPESRIKVIAPLIKMRKENIVLKGLKLGVPFQYTWSCYKNSKHACGNCSSCRLRLKGFKEANSKDSIKYF